MTERSEIIDRMLPARTRRVIIWRAFIWAAVATPVILAISGAIFLGYGVIVTLFAAILGFPAYVAFGIPAAFLALSRLSDGSRGADYLALFVVGIFANIGSFAGAYLYSLITEGPGTRPTDDAIWYAALGLVFGPIQALIFGAVYRSLTVQKRTPKSIQLKTRKQGDVPCA